MIEAAPVMSRRRWTFSTTAAGEMALVAQDAGLALGARLGVGLGDIDPAGDVDMAARRVAAQGSGRLLERGAVLLHLLGQPLERRPGRQHEAETHAPGDGDRALRRAGQEDRRVRLLQRMREKL